MKKNNEETVLRTISLVDGEIQNANGVIYNIESLKNSEKNFLNDNNKLDYFIGYGFESIEANDVRVAYRMTGDFKVDEDGKERYHIDKIVGMDIMPKENFNK